MSIAASLLVLAAASAPQPARTAPPPPVAGPAQAAQPQPGATAGVHATASATAVILRAAVVRFGEPVAASAQGDETIYRQPSRQGRHVSIDFN